MYVLIAIGMFYYYNNGMIMTSQEFSSKEKCEIALSKIEEAHRKYEHKHRSRYIVAYCVEK